MCEEAVYMKMKDTQLFVKCSVYFCHNKTSWRGGQIYLFSAM